MFHSKVEVYIHVVWATRGREPLLTPDIIRPVYRSIGAEVEALKSIVLAIGGMPDHVHLLARTASGVSVAQLAGRVKGASARFANAELGLDYHFSWQGGYGGFSISRSHVQRVMAYIRNQERRHTDGTLWPEWEETYEEVDEPADDHGAPGGRSAEGL